MEKTIKTRLTKGANVHETKLVIDFTDVPQEQLEELAARSIIISTQANYRAAEVVPPTDTVNVAELLKRERTGGKKATPESIAAKALKMSPEERATLLKLLKGGK